MTAMINIADACIFQGAAFPRFRFGNHRASSRAGHAPNGWIAKVHADHLAHDVRGLVGDLRGPDFCGLLLEGSDSLEDLGGRTIQSSGWFRQSPLVHWRSESAFDCGLNDSLDGDDFWGLGTVSRAPCRANC